MGLNLKMDKKMLSSDPGQTVLGTNVEDTGYKINSRRKGYRGLMRTYKPGAFGKGNP